MNIEIANRLVKLRKEKQFSQEALANELGISRQAVSKWERAEASPDTDNLILLAKLYGISLDELLQTDQEKFESGETIEEPNEEKQEETNANQEYVHISFKDGIHVKEKDGDEVHVGWDGIHVKERNHGNNEVHIGSGGVFVNGKEYNGQEYCKAWKEEWKHHGFPISVIVCVIYIYIGIVYHAWHPGWLIFGIIPLFETLSSAIRHRDPMRFAYPILIFMVIGYFGFMQGIWYPYWLLVLTIPIYYSLLSYVRHIFRKHKQSQDKNQ